MNCRLKLQKIQREVEDFFQQLRHKTCAVTWPFATKKIIIIACSLLPMIAERPQFYALTKVCVQLLIKRLLLPSCDYDKVIKGISFYPFDSAPNATLASLHSARNFIFDLFFICFKLNLHFVQSEACIIKYAYIPRLLGCQKIFNKSARRGY